MSLVLAAAAYGQNYHKFKAGLAFGLTQVTNPILALETAYRLSDAFAIGVRFETTSDATKGYVSEQSISSITINSQYYFSAKKVRPFIGAGLGQYFIAGRYDDIPKKFGFYPRLGIDMGHASLSLEYNMLPSTSVDSDVFYLDANGVYHSLTDTFTFSYLGIKIGFFVGGGKKG